jgi:hypothetical protein
MKRIDVRHRSLAIAVVTVLVVAAALLVVVDLGGESAINPRPARAEAATLSGSEHGADAIGYQIPVNAAAAPDDLSPATLASAGWQCLFVVHAVHCAPPDGLEGMTSGRAESVTVLVFDTNDPGSDHARYLGSEYNIRADLFHGEPCVSDPQTMQYTYLGSGGLGLGLDYYACHGFDSPL